MSPRKYETMVRQDLSTLEKAVSFEPAKPGESPSLVIDHKTFPVSIFLAPGNGEPVKVGEITLEEVDRIFALLKQQ